MIRAFLCTTIFALVLNAKPQFLNLLLAKVPPGSLVQNCMTCHSGGASLNNFGRDFYFIFVAPDNIKFPGIATATIDQKWDFFLNKLDSNKNGKTNLQDIVAKLNPGK